VTTVQLVVTATVMGLRQNMLKVTLWRYNFVIFLFTDVDFMRHLSSVTYKIDVVK